MDKKQIVIKTIAHLRCLADGTIEPINENYGICSEIYNLRGSQVIYREIVDLMKIHPDFSGVGIFPIPCPNENPKDAFLYDKKWDINTVYGRTRREWCAWLADVLENKYLDK